MQMSLGEFITCLLIAYVGATVITVIWYESYILELRTSKQQGRGNTCRKEA